MAKRDLKSGMRASMKLEEDATNARFERADTIFATPEPPVVPTVTRERDVRPQKAIQKEQVRHVLQTFSISQVEIELLEGLKSAAAEAAFSRSNAAARQAALGTNKSELVRIAIGVLASFSSTELLDLIVRAQSDKSHAMKGNTKT